MAYRRQHGNGLSYRLTIVISGDEWQQLQALYESHPSAHKDSSVGQMMVRCTIAHLNDALPVNGHVAVSSKRILFGGDDMPRASLRNHLASSISDPDLNATPDAYFAISNELKWHDPADYELVPDLSDGNITALLAGKPVMVLRKRK